jgi:hypothetical protein
MRLNGGNKYSHKRTKRSNATPRRMHPKRNTRLNKIQSRIKRANIFHPPRPDIHTKAMHTTKKAATPKVRFLEKFDESRPSLHRAVYSTCNIAALQLEGGGWFVNIFEV